MRACTAMFLPDVPELSALREERTLIRDRVNEMLQQIESLNL